MIFTSFILPVIVAVACIFAYSLITKKLNKSQNAADDNRSCGDDVLDNVSLLFFLQEMICDKSGNVVDFNIVKVNKPVLKSSLRGETTPVGKRSSEYYPDGLEVFTAAANSAIQFGQPINFQYMHQSCNIYYDCVARVREKTNCVEFYLIDSTNLHKTQEALCGMRRQMQIALEVSHVTPIKMFVNSQLITCQMLDDEKLRDGRSHDERALRNVTMTGDELFSKFSEETRRELRGLLDDLRDDKIQRVKYDMSCEEDRGKGIRKEWYEIRVVVGERDANGKPAVLEGSIQLVTKRKMMEQCLTEAKNKAEELNKLKTAFLANMSHEIRTPLNAIVGFSELLVGADTKEVQQEYSRIIQSNSEQLLQLVGDILDLSKIEAGTMEFVDKDFELNLVMKEVEESMRLRLDPDKPVTMRCELGLPKCMLHCDTHRFVQVLTNLITNAIKYTDSGNIVMGYSLKGKFLEFYVKDTGSGIDKKHLNDIFDRFVKLNAFVKGSGLGLSISKSIVNRFGGKIWAESELGKGSTFYFTMPYDPMSCKQEEPKCEEPKPEPQFKEQPVKPEKEKPHVLVAEDNESNYKLVSAILSREYKLYHAWNGQEAVDIFDECKPEIVIMDINMPVMDGYQASALLKKHSPKTPILALTAYATSADEEKILAAGMDAYMSKPVCMPQLRMRIKELIMASKN